MRLRFVFFALAFVLSYGWTETASADFLDEICEDRGGELEAGQCVCRASGKEKATYIDPTTQTCPAKAVQRLESISGHKKDDCFPESVIGKKRKLRPAGPGRIFLVYPGLTRAEENLVEYHPAEAARVYCGMKLTDALVLTYFDKIKSDDESDAFRHFLWSAILYKAIGEERARIYLNAHEEKDRLQNKSAKAMDLYNNQMGLEAAKKLLAENRWSRRNVEELALEALKDGKLKVLKPGSIPEKATEADIDFLDKMIEPFCRKRIDVD